MKKIFAVLALTGILAACNNSKKEDKKPEDKTANTTTTTNTDDHTVMANGAVPNFSDPEVQQFANDYAAFITEYKAGTKDPKKLMELSKSMQDWAGRAQSIGMKLANNPGEAKKWADWVMVVNKQLTDPAMEMSK